MLSPCTFKRNVSAFGRRSTGIGKYPSIFSTARIGSPAATLPISGICATSLWDAVSSDAIPWIAPRRPVWNPSSQISMALGFVSSRLIYPFRSSVSRCACTEDVERRETASQISRTDGGNPLCKISCFKYSRICLCFSVSLFLSPAIVCSSCRFVFI